MSETKLKPCPFCGARLENIEKYRMLYQHPSNDCFFSELIVKQNEVEKWNTRKPMDNIVAELEEEEDYSYADMDEYARRYELNLADCDDWFYKGLARAIDIVKRGAAE